MAIQGNADHGMHSSRDSGDEFEVARGVPADRVRWGPILAGTFAALTALAVLGTLGAAVGLSSYDQGQDDPRKFAMAGGVWGILTMIIAFGIGGWLAARSAAIHGRDNGLLNGALVAAVGIPLMLFLFGSAGTAMGSAAAANSHDQQQARGQSDDNAITASARMGGSSSDASSQGGSSASSADRERAQRAGSRTAWALLASMVLALGASAAAGYAGARRTDHDELGRREAIRS